MKKTLKEIWRSIFRQPWPRTAVERSATVVGNVFLHLHPATVRRHALRFTFTFGLGGTAIFLFVLLVGTGILLCFYYSPSPEEAYRSMEDLRSVIPFGRFLRNLHRWAAHGMVIVVFLHLCRVFYTGSYKRPRQFNWVVGVFLFLLTLGLSFTGYLLPWDQLAYWAIQVGTTIVSYVPSVGEDLRFVLLGGNVINEATLLRFYVLHCFVLPLAVIVLCALHFWRVRKDGGISGPPLPPPEPAPTGEPPPSTKTYGLMAVARRRGPPGALDPRDRVAVWPHLVYRELLWALIAFNVLCIVSYFVDAPLESIADPTETPNPAKAPWYFLGLQELVHYSAFWGGVAAPGLVVLLLLLTPYIDRNPRGSGVWFHRSRRLATVVFTFIMGTSVILTLIGTFFRGESWHWVWPW